MTGLEANWHLRLELLAYQYVLWAPPTVFKLPPWSAPETWEGGREGEREREREDTDLLSLNISNLNRKITKVHYLNVGDILECAVE